jgi:guanosine-3',5'-bis(diphosphate) 3'-pyrophosphohydrolase
MTDLVTRARVFATAAHAAVSQLRKYTFEPYIVHPAEVANMVESIGGTPEMIAAAWLHDVVEDTGVTLELIRAEFGDEVADLVGWLTDVSRPDHGNRAARKAVDRAHTAAAPAAAQTIKLADLIANTRSIVEHDEEFARVYLAEKRALLEVMTKGDARLREQAAKQVG